jgi:hypothetical protein
MAYSSIVKPTDYFNTVLYTGNGSTQSITGVGFQPDWVWLKLRSTTGNHGLYDAVRGATKRLQSNQTSAEDTITSFSSFDSDGFTLSEASQNNNGETFASWNWLAGGSGSSNSDGSITSTVSANTTAGFSIVSYTGNGTGGATFGHGLGSAPKIVIIKSRSLGTESWQFWFNNTSRLNLNSTTASLTTHPISTSSTLVTTPSSSNDSWNTSGQTYISYCFAEKKGYSKFGSYSGNGDADGTFVYTGFRPAFVLYKRADGTNGWTMLDTSRETENVMGDKNLAPHANSAEFGNSNYYLDFLSNGFKPRTADDQINVSGGTYIYMAFAENPFVANDSGTAVPVVAR